MARVRPPTRVGRNKPQGPIETVDEAAGAAATAEYETYLANLAHRRGGEVTPPADIASIRPNHRAGAAFIATEGARKLSGALAESIFQNDLAEIRAGRAGPVLARAKELFRELSEIYGAAQASKKWKAIPPPRKTKGAPVGSRDLQRDRNLIVWVEWFALKHPELKGRPLRNECAEFLANESPKEFGNSPAAIEKHIDRLLKKRGHKV